MGESILSCAIVGTDVALNQGRNMRPEDDQKINYIIGATVLYLE